VRAKIRFDTSLLEDEIVVRLRKQGFTVLRWAGRYDDAGNEERRARLWSRIAEQQRREAELGAMFLLYDPETRVDGMLGREQGRWVLRLANPQVSVAQLITERVVAGLSELAAQKERPIEFGDIDIMETGAHNAILIGRLMVTPEAREAYVRRHRPVEYRVVRWGGAVAIALIVIGLCSMWMYAEPALHWSLRWAFEFFRGFLGAAVVTTCVAYFHIRALRATLQDTPVHWELPRR